jgi:hypothetical protein
MNRELFFMGNLQIGLLAASRILPEAWNFLGNPCQFSNLIPRIFCYTWEWIADNCRLS